MKVEKLIETMEYDVKVKMDVNENDEEPLYDGICGGVPFELTEREVTGVYAGEYFIGIDTD